MLLASVLVYVMVICGLSICGGSSIRTGSMVRGGEDDDGGCPSSPFSKAQNAPQARQKNLLRQDVLIQFWREKFGHTFQHELKSV
jgi:hypothetical protein